MKISEHLRQRIRKQVIKALRNPENREVIVKSAYKMNTSELEDLKNSIPALHNSQLVNDVDVTLLGGFIVIDGSTIFDYSVKGKLKDVVGSLLESYH